MSAHLASVRVGSGLQCESYAASAAPLAFPQHGQEDGGPLGTRSGFPVNRRWTLADGTAPLAVCENRSGLCFSASVDERFDAGPDLLSCGRHRAIEVQMYLQTPDPRPAPVADAWQSDPRVHRTAG
eukprot:CAMPEP_0114545370 /NCGR_PEP_ID=MMETSP0114-20121206/3363_1 /TAXON_ID=31324 /ORGANISM="Goniomonas sp, Strain m" /LENGTH=125 /DNA_ID=CAMNT_0001729791 /DNA_START=563 /DNA_END=940 /DNA_ORIENTATION=+